MADPDVCPFCDGLVVRRCRCLLGDGACGNGHEWHLCPRCSAVVPGAADHAHGGTWGNWCEACKLTRG